MYSLRRVAPPLVLTLALCANGAMAQNSAPTLSLAHPDWVSSEAFSSVAALRVLSSGALLVADRKEVEVHLLDATGKVIRQVGRKGSGPAEYTDPERLIALPADSTLLLDRDARRYLVIDSRGQIAKTEVISPALGSGAESISAADSKGRLFFGSKLASMADDAGADTPIGRWTRGSDRFDTVSMFHPENPVVRPAQNLPKGFKALAGKARVVFAAVDDWVAAPSGRIAVIHAVPYRVDWVELNGKTTVGKPVAVTRVPVTDRDRKLYEPNGPPFQRVYATLKSPFIIESAVVDERENV